MWSWEKERHICSYVPVGGEDGWWYWVSGYLVYLIRDVFLFAVNNLYLSTYVPGTYQQPWLYIVLY